VPTAFEDFDVIVEKLFEAWNIWLLIGLQNDLRLHIGQNSESEPSGLVTSFLVVSPVVTVTVASRVPLLVAFRLRVRPCQFARSICTILTVV
jgi:hypothetical protein